MEDFANCGYISIEKSRCIRTNYSKSLCRDCKDICITDAVIFSSPISINKNRCIKCGLCYVACKFSAVNIKNDNEKLSKITKNRKDIDIGCIFSDADIKVACISRITEDLLVRWFAGSKAVNISRGECKKCKLKMTLPYFIRSLRKSIILSKSLDIEPSIKIKTQKKKKVYIPKDGFSRREMLSGFGIISNSSVSKRYSLKQTLKDRIKKDIEYKDSAVLKISDNCNLCGICEHICPVDAIFIEKKGTKGSIYFDPSACVGCMECGNACAYNAITLHKSTVSQLYSKPYRVFEAEKKVCRVCDREFYSNSRSSVCFICKSKEKGKSKIMKFLKDI